MSGRKAFQIFLFVIPLLALIRCANPVTPQGGPKDKKPPVVLSCIPPNNTVHFDKKTIHISFDEFVQLKDPVTKVNVCPPLLPKNDYRLRGKTLIIQMEDSLKPNTTYSLNFGDAISDITENNVLRDFAYVFSTGSYLDSMNIQGKIFDAFTLKPQGDIYAMLYSHTPSDTLPLDSLPFHASPYYKVKTDSNGYFSFHHIRNTEYLLIGLKDQNGDGYYDMSTEKIAFYDSLVKGNYIPPMKTDTLPGDSLKKKKDTLSESMKAFPLFTMRMFEAFDSTQKILKTNVINKNEVQISFRYSTKNPEISPLNFTPSGPWMIQEYSPKRDSVTLWLKNFTKDSLVMVVKDKNLKGDTLIVDLNPNRFLKKSSKKEKEALKTEKLSFTSNFQASRLNQFISQPEISFSYPLTRFDPSGVKLIEGKDTLSPEVVFCDSIHRRIKLLTRLKEEKKYQLLIPDSALVSYNGLTNDTIRIGFTTSSEKDFGNLIFDLSAFPFNDQLIVQLTNDKDIKIREIVLPAPGKIKFDYLNPAIYKVKIIRDKNRNRRWDTGNFRERLQPEEVYNYSKAIEIRANWDVEEQWGQ
ncbi:MAG: Ig-like domain-containing protein [Bacteroidota bacterium]|nr:Ig-like domain-containing protein [Bacteroidota bacterium]